MNIQYVFKEEFADETIAYYCAEEDRLVVILETLIRDTINHWRYWAKWVLNIAIEEFTLLNIQRVFLYELIQWANLTDKFQAEFTALKLALERMRNAPLEDLDEIARTIAERAVREED